MLSSKHRDSLYHLYSLLVMISMEQAWSNGATINKVNFPWERRCGGPAKGCESSELLILFVISLSQIVPIQVLKNVIVPRASLFSVIKINHALRKCCWPVKFFERKTVPKGWNAGKCRERGVKVLRSVFCMAALLLYMGWCYLDYNDAVFPQSVVWLCERWQAKQGLTLSWRCLNL